MGLGPRRFARIEQLCGERTIMLTGRKWFVRIRSRFGQQPALRPLGPHLLRDLVGLRERLDPAVVHRLEILDACDRKIQPCGELLQPPSCGDWIRLEPLPGKPRATGHLSHRALESGIRSTAFRQSIKPLDGGGDVCVERGGQFACFLMRLLQRIEWRAALPRHVGQRGSGLGGVEQFDRLLGLRRAEEGFLADPFLGLLPHIHQTQPPLAIAAKGRLNVVVGRPREALHRRLEVGIAVGQHAMAFLLAVEQIGERHHLALEGGEFLPRLGEPTFMPGPLHEKRRDRSEARQRRQAQRQGAGAKHACRFGLCLFDLDLFLHPPLGRSHEVGQPLVVLSVLGSRHEHLVDQFLLDGLRIQPARHFQPPRCLHGDLPILDVEYDRHIAGGVERGRAAVALTTLRRLLLPPLDQTLEQFCRRIAIASGVSHHDHAIVPAALKPGLLDRRPHLRERVLHSRDEDPLGVGGRGVGWRNLRMGDQTGQPCDQQC